VKTHEKYWSLLIHESAHAVSMLEYGLGLDHVQVFKTGLFGTGFEGNTRCGLLGFTEDDLAEDPAAFYQVKPAEQLISCLASIPAQYRSLIEMGYSRWRASSRTASCAKGDVEKGAVLAQYSPWSWSKCQGEADEFVSDCWDEINVVAEALLDAGGFLDGDDVVSLVEWSRAAV